MPGIVSLHPCWQRSPVLFVSLLCPQKYPLARPQSWEISSLGCDLCPAGTNPHFTAHGAGDCVAPRAGAAPSFLPWLEFIPGMAGGEHLGRWAQRGQTGTRAARSGPALHINNILIPPLQSQHLQQLHTGNNLELSLVLNKNILNLASFPTT